MTTGKKTRQSAHFLIFAIKDSSGDWENTGALLADNALKVLVGDERHLHRALVLGAAGSICGIANLYPNRLARLFETAAEDPELCAEVTEIVMFPVVPALKALMAEHYQELGWQRLRAPLKPLSEAERSVLFSALKAVR